MNLAEDRTSSLLLRSSGLTGDLRGMLISLGIPRSSDATDNDTGFTEPGALGATRAPHGA
jgi:hypothetical protein